MAILNPPFGRAQVAEIVARQASPRLQIVAGKGRFPNAISTDSGGTGINHDARVAVRNGPVDCSGIRLAFVNAYSDGTTDVSCPNAITVAAAIELFGGVRNERFTFRGGLTLNIAPNSGILLSDPIDFPWPANFLAGIRLNVAITSGQSFPVAYNVQSGSAIGAESTGGENCVTNSGATVVGSTGAISGTAVAGLVPVAILGVPCGQSPAIAILGDSIAEASGDSVTTNLTIGQGVGYVARGLTLSNLSMLPFSNISRGGQAMDGLVTTSRGLDIQRRLSVLQYATDVYIHLGTNDLVGLPTLEQMQTRSRSLWAYCRMFRVRITHAKVLPRCTGTYTSAAGQTHLNASFTPGGVRDQYNAWLDTALAAGEIDAVHDPNVELEDPAAPGKWISTGGIARTNDGVHPNTQGHQDGAVGVRDRWAAPLALNYRIAVS